jgi:hypothetical protein
MIGNRQGKTGEYGDENTATGYLFTINCVACGNRYPVAAFSPENLIALTQ